MAVPLIIDELWAWISVTDEGEGVLGAPIPGLGNMPLVGADRERMESLRPVAQQVAALFGVGVSLVRFSSRELIENHPAPTGSEVTGA